MWLSVVEETVDGSVGDSDCGPTSYLMPESPPVADCRCRPTCAIIRAQRPGEWRHLPAVSENVSIAVIHSLFDIPHREELI